ncbi:GntR family transcriptional regulator [Marinomonas spartinae]|uniref:GntR family transcriptional regulator n=1 Tax=Marinomonas spartinae TaxID=1792290 RepID=UPI0018F1767B|nr:GntR family transcriptional regulator [Marinomonas spartinae]MBJ7554886.1 GntR family transcriptional regulator [Marinomonas spartinae]
MLFTTQAATAEEEAYRYIQNKLRMGHYPPNSRLIADDIATQIGVSRMPVREALRRLAGDGLVILRSNRSCIVAGLTLDELYENFEIRSVLEGLAIRLAMPRIDQDVITELEFLLDRMEFAGSKSGTDWVVQHQEFHNYIVRLSGRPKLIRQIAAQHIIIEPYMRIWFDSIEKPISSRQEHQELINAFKSGDVNLAENVIKEHILETAPLLAEYATPNPRPSA